MPPAAAQFISWACRHHPHCLCWQWRSLSSSCSPGLMWGCPLPAACWTTFPSELSVLSKSRPCGHCLERCLFSVLLSEGWSQRGWGENFLKSPEAKHWTWWNQKWCLIFHLNAMCRQHPYLFSKAFATATHKTIATKLNDCRLRLATISPSLQLGLRGAVHFLAGWQVLVSQLQCSLSTRHSQSLGPDLFCLVVFFTHSGLRKCLGWSPSLLNAYWWDSLFSHRQKGFSFTILLTLVLHKKTWLKFTFLLNAFPLASVMTGKCCFVKHIFI